MREQDEHMDEAIKSVERIKHITLDIHDELDNQERDLRRLDREVEGVKGLINRSRKRLEKLLKNSKGVCVCMNVSA